MNRSTRALQPRNYTWRPASLPQFMGLFAVAALALLFFRPAPVDASGGKEQGARVQGTSTYTDPLTGSGTTTGFSSKSVAGGSFSANGWQTGTVNDRIRLKLDAAAMGDCTVEVDVTNFDPSSQSSSAKHEIINMYTTSAGDKSIFSTDGCWWNIRTGTNYGTGLKFLSAPRGDATRVETRLLDGTTWDPNATYTFKVVWNSTQIKLYLDGTRLVTHDFSGRVEGMQYLFVGKNNVYDGQVGPVYSNVRVTYDPAILPVELSAFDAQVVGDAVLLNWETASEVNNLGFDLERRLATDGDFVRIGFVPGAGTTSSVQQYVYRDERPGTGRCEYRLRQIDLDGSATYSEAVSVVVGLTERYQLLQTYPNPAQRAGMASSPIQIRFSLERPSRNSLKVYNVIGQQVAALGPQWFAAGTHHQTWDGRNSAGQLVVPGVYYITLEAGLTVTMDKVVILP